MAVTSIETGRTLEVEVMTRYYQGCINTERFKDNAGLYEHLKLDHVCKSNHEVQLEKWRWWVWKEHSRDRSKPVDCVIQIIIFSDLSDDNLLRKCLHGKTQNQNKSFNRLIWRRTPKDCFVKMTTFELACTMLSPISILVIL